MKRRRKRLNYPKLIFGSLAFAATMWISLAIMLLL